MVTSVNGFGHAPIDDNNRVDRTGLQPTSPATAGQSAVSAFTPAGIIQDTPDISDAAKARLAQEAQTQPFVQALKAMPDDALSQTRIERFKTMIADGSIQRYLDGVGSATAQAMLASPIATVLTR
jgi:hypothetical protein